MERSLRVRGSISMKVDEWTVFRLQWQRKMEGWSGRVRKDKQP